MNLLMYIPLGVHCVQYIITAFLRISKIGWLWGNSGSLRIKGAIISPSVSLASCKWSDSKFYNWPCVLFVFPGFWSWWPMIWLKELLFDKNDSLQRLCGLIASHSMCRPWFWPAMIHLASASVDGCCIYIIIHNGMSQWSLVIGSAPWSGRSAPKFLRAIDVHACNKYHTKKSNVGPWVC